MALYKMFTKNEAQGQKKNTKFNNVVGFRVVVNMHLTQHIHMQWVDEKKSFRKY